MDEFFKFSEEFGYIRDFPLKVWWCFLALTVLCFVVSFK